MELQNIVDWSVVAIGVVTGLPGVDTFHCILIENPWARVQVKKVFSGDLALPVPNVEEKQEFLKNVVGLNTLWSARFLWKC